MDHPVRKLGSIPLISLEQSEVQITKGRTDTFMSLKFDPPVTRWANIERTCLVDGHLLANMKDETKTLYHLDGVTLSQLSTQHIVGFNGKITARPDQSAAYLVCEHYIELWKWDEQTNRLIAQGTKCAVPIICIMSMCCSPTRVFVLSRQSSTRCLLSIFDFELKHSKEVYMSIEGPYTLTSVGETVFVLPTHSNESAWTLTPDLKLQPLLAWFGSRAVGIGRFLYVLSEKDDLTYWLTRYTEHFRYVDAYKLSLEWPEYICPIESGVVVLDHVYSKCVCVRTYQHVRLFLCGLLCEGSVVAQATTRPLYDKNLLRVIVSYVKIKGRL